MLAYRTSIRPSVRPQALFAVGCPICFVLARPLARRPFHSHQAVLKRPSRPAVKYDFLRDIICSTEWKHSVDPDNIGGGMYKKTTGQIMLALHAAERKSRYQSPLPTYCNWGDCEASFARSGRLRGEERLFCARSWMGLVLCIPIACPRRIESSNQMRFRNIRPPRAEGWLSAPA